MNYGLESSSGIRYDVHQQTYVQERDGMTYKLDKETQQWIPLQSYTDETNHIKYTFSKKHNTWIPDVSTYSAKDPEGKEQTYVWLKDQLNWALLSTVDAYTDHITGMKYKWNNQTNSWDNEGVEPIDNDNDEVKPPKPTAAAAAPPEAQNAKKKAAEGSSHLIFLVSIAYSSILSNDFSTKIVQIVSPIPKQWMRVRSYLQPLHQCLHRK